MREARCCRVDIFVDIFATPGVTGYVSVISWYFAPSKSLSNGLMRDARCDRADIFATPGVTG